jgi:hypothetical protein
MFHQVGVFVWVPQCEVLDQLLAAGPELEEVLLLRPLRK